MKLLKEVSHKYELTYSKVILLLYLIDQCAGKCTGAIARLDLAGTKAPRVSPSLNINGSNLYQPNYM